MQGYRKLFWISFMVVAFMNGCHTKKHRNNSNNKRIKSRSNSANTMSVDELLHEICMPSGTHMLVYRYQNYSHIFIGFDDMNSDTLYSMTWKINEGNPEALTSHDRNRFQSLPASEIRKTLRREHVLAAANEKLQDKFLDRISMCSQSRITSRACVIQSFATLARKMKEVTFGQPCNK